MTTPTLPEELEGLLGEMLGAHEKALEAARAHREAIAKADAAGISKAIEAQQVTLAHLQALDSKRAGFVSQILGDETPPARAAVTKITDLLPMVPEDRRGALATLAERVRECARTLQVEQRTIREASKSLSQHIQGMISRVAQSLSHAGTYDGRGGVRDRSAVVSGIDVTS